MKKILKIVVLSLFFFVVFLLLTFPYYRLAPRIQSFLELSLRKNFGINASCHLEDLNFSFPLRFEWRVLTCMDTGSDQMLIDLRDAHLSIFPGSQTLTGLIGKSPIEIRLNAGFRSLPSRVTANLKSVPLERITPLLFTSLRRSVMNDFSVLKIEGALSGKVDFPIGKLTNQDGDIDLRLENLKVPPQALLDMIGLKDLIFSKSVIRAQMKSGRLSFSEVELLSPPLSAKVEGQIAFSDPIARSVPAITLKWHVQKSDALLSAPFGQIIANFCPSPDNQGFCTRRFTRMSDFSSPM